jgi:DNA-binding PucR family transcriptional regulator
VDALVGTEAASGDRPLSWLLVPDPDGPGRAPTLAAAVTGRAAAIGPAVPPAEACLSLRLARLTLRLARAGALPAAPVPVRADAHLGLLALLQDEELARALAAARLGPLAVLLEADRARLTETLASWLAHQRHVPTVAAELHVHPQTVRYRLGQLRELLGPVLEDPDGRFELELALRAERALRARSGAAAGP